MTHEYGDAPMLVSSLLLGRAEVLETPRRRLGAVTVPTPREASRDVQTDEDSRPRRYLSTPSKPRDDDLRAEARELQATLLDSTRRPATPRFTPAKAPSARTPMLARQRPEGTLLSRLRDHEMNEFGDDDIGTTPSLYAAAPRPRTPPKSSRHTRGFLADRMHDTVDTSQAIASEMRHLNAAREVEEEVDALRGALRALQGEQEAVRVEVGGLRRERDVLLSDVESARQDRDRAEARAAGIQRESEKAQAELKVAMDALDNERAAAQSNHAEVQRLRLQTKASRSESDRAQSEASELRAQLDERLAELQRVKTESDAAQRSAAHSRAEAKQLAALVTQAREECDAAQRAATQSRADADRSRAEADRSRAETDRSLAEISQLTASLDQARAETARLSARVVSPSRAAPCPDCARWRDAMERAASEAAVLRDELDEARDEEARAKRRIDVALEEAGRVRQQAARVASENDQLRGQLSAAEDKMEETLRTQQQAAARMEAEREALRKSLRVAEEALQSEEERTKNWEREMAELRHLRAVMDTRQRDLAQQELALEAERARLHGELRNVWPGSFAVGRSDDPGSVLHAQDVLRMQQQIRADSAMGASPWMASVSPWLAVPQSAGPYGAASLAQNGPVPVTDARGERERNGRRNRERSHSVSSDDEGQSRRSRHAERSPKAEPQATDTERLRIELQSSQRAAKDANDRAEQMERSMRVERAEREELQARQARLADELQRARDDLNATASVLVGATAGSPVLERRIKAVVSPSVNDSRQDNRYKAVSTPRNDDDGSVRALLQRLREDVRNVEREAREFAIGTPVR